MFADASPLDDNAGTEEQQFVGTYRMQGAVDIDRPAPFEAEGHDEGIATDSLFVFDAMNVFNQRDMVIAIDSHLPQSFIL